MTSIVWPSTLPQKPRQQGYGETLGENMIASENDVGPEKRRRRFTANKIVYSLTMRMGQEQKEALYDFYEDELESGVLRFNFPNPSGEGFIVVRFKKGQTPSPRAVGPALYDVALVLERQP